MLSLREAADHFARAALEVKIGMDREVRLGMEGAAKKARSFIGEPQIGWAELAESTISDKQRHGYDTPKPLLRTGGLKESIEGETESEAVGVRGVVGSSSDLAILHEHGTSRMPPRPFLGPALILQTPEICTSLAEMLVRALTPGKRV